MKKFILILSTFAITFLVVVNSFGFKEAIQENNLEVGIGESFGGFGIKVGYETSFSKNAHFYGFFVFGGIGKNVGFGVQIEFPIKIFERSFFSLAISPLGNLRTTFNSITQSSDIDLGAGVYPLFTFDFRKISEVPLSISFGAGPEFNFLPFWVTAYYSIVFSFYIDNFTIQLGANSRIAGIDFKIKI